MRRVEASATVDSPRSDITGASPAHPADGQFVHTPIGHRQRLGHPNTRGPC